MERVNGADLFQGDVGRDFWRDQDGHGAAPSTTGEQGC